jgi:hypothetical protein
MHGSVRIKKMISFELYKTVEFIAQLRMPAHPLKLKVIASLHRHTDNIFSMRIKIPDKSDLIVKVALSRSIC